MTRANRPGLGAGHLEPGRALARRHSQQTETTAACSKRSSTRPNSWANQNLGSGSCSDGRSPPPGPGCSESSPEIVLFADDAVRAVIALTGYMVTFYSNQILKLQDRFARQARWRASSRTCSAHCSCWTLRAFKPSLRWQHCTEQRATSRGTCRRLLDLLSQEKPRRNPPACHCKLAFLCTR